MKKQRRKIKDTGKTRRRIDPAEVGKALGAKDVLKVVRTHPALPPMAHHWAEMQPLKPEPIPSKTIVKLVITGGLIHDFARGWVWEPYQLEKVEQTVPIKPPTRFYMVPTKCLEVLDRVEGRKLPTLKRIKWTVKIMLFGEKTAGS